jgi:SAM-dependent methyltransferase
MQDNGGLKSFLSVSWIYEQFQNLVGTRHARRWLAENYWRLNGGEKVVDMGCGPGRILDYLPKDITYVGFDISADYIAAAQRQFGERATFIVSTTDEFLRRPDNRLSCSDLVLCNGLLHHVDDSEARDVLQLAKGIMAPTGRLVCIEPTFLVHQGRSARWIMGRDRGSHIRTEQEWRRLVSDVFDSFATSIATGLIRIPYAHIVIECGKG